jgi:PACS-1 cytosolic sorting protein
LQDVRLFGQLEGTQHSLDLDESLNVGLNSQLSSSPPNTGRISPPTQTNTPLSQEPLELQVDFWPLSRPMSEGKDKSQSKSQDQGKNSVKSSFKNLQVFF